MSVEGSEKSPGFSFNTYTMKKAIPFLGAVLMCTSCATVFTPKITDSQKRKPGPGELQREIRPGFLIADILLSGPIGLVVDFATGAIYKPGTPSTTGTVVSK